MIVKRNQNKHRNRHVIRYFSRKSGHVVKLETFLELSFACKLECDPDVLTYSTQVETMHLKIEGKNRRFTPDFLIQYRNGHSEYVEIHHSKYTTEEYLAKYNAFRRYCLQETGIDIRLIVSEQLNVMEMKNFELIAASMSDSIDFDPESVNFPGELTFGELIDGLSCRGTSAVSDAYYLLGNGYFSFRRDEMLTADTLLRRGKLC